MDANFIVCYAGLIIIAIMMTRMLNKVSGENKKM